nr:Tubulin polyglutamylase ttll13P [Polyrhizophydium stewartii]
MHEICRKDHLARNLGRISRLFPKDYNFFPKTWILPSEWSEFKMSHKPRRSQSYIAKPDHGCQGKGIFLFRDPEQVHEHRNSNMIVQSYLSQPCLIDGFKFDLRIYVLVTSVDPLRVFIYRDGLARFATEKYHAPTEKNISSVCMHLTNYAINKHSEKFVVDEETGSKRSIQSVFRQLAEQRGTDTKELWRRISDVVVKTIITVQPQISRGLKSWFPSASSIQCQAAAEAGRDLAIAGAAAAAAAPGGPSAFVPSGPIPEGSSAPCGPSQAPSTSVAAASTSATPPRGASIESIIANMSIDGIGSQCFEILGFDIFLDAKLKPWVLEVNHSPSFTCDSPLDREIKSGVILGALRLLNLNAALYRRWQKQEKAKSQTRLWKYADAGAGPQAAANAAGSAAAAGKQEAAASSEQISGGAAKASAAKQAPAGAGTSQLSSDGDPMKRIVSVSLTGATVCARSGALGTSGSSNACDVANGADDGDGCGDSAAEYDAGDDDCSDDDDDDDVDDNASHASESVACRQRQQPEPMMLGGGSAMQPPSPPKVPIILVHAGDSAARRATSASSSRRPRSAVSLASTARGTRRQVVGDQDSSSASDASSSSSRCSSRSRSPGGSSGTPHPIGASSMSRLPTRPRAVMGRAIGMTEMRPGRSALHSRSRTFDGVPSSRAGRSGSAGVGAARSATPLDGGGSASSSRPASASHLLRGRATVADTRRECLVGASEYIAGASHSTSSSASSQQWQQQQQQQQHSQRSKQAVAIAQARALDAYHEKYHAALLAKLSEFEDANMGNYERVFPPDDPKKLAKYLYLVSETANWSSETNSTKARREFLQRKREKEELEQRRFEQWKQRRQRANPHVQSKISTSLDKSLTTARRTLSMNDAQLRKRYEAMVRLQGAALSNADVRAVAASPHVAMAMSHVLPPPVLGSAAAPTAASPSGIGMSQASIAGARSLQRRIGLLHHSQKYIRQYGSGPSGSSSPRTSLPPGSSRVSAASSSATVHTGAPEHWQSSSSLSARSSIELASASAAAAAAAAAVAAIRAGVSNVSARRNGGGGGGAPKRDGPGPARPAHAGSQASLHLSLFSAQSSSATLAQTPSSVPTGPGASTPIKHLVPIKINNLNDHFRGGWETHGGGGGGGGSGISVPSRDSVSSIGGMGGTHTSTPFSPALAGMYRSGASVALVRLDSSGAVSGGILGTSHGAALGDRGHAAAASTAMQKNAARHRMQR